jgi:hypothetical protein
MAGREWLHCVCVDRRASSTNDERRWLGARLVKGQNSQTERQAANHRAVRVVA